MPELVTKYPELALKELKDAGIKCGVNDPQKILITCPPQQFCKLPTGEFCIYGVKEVPQMTQIHMFDLLVFPSTAITLSAMLVMVFLIGLTIGLRMKKR